MARQLLQKNSASDLVAVTTAGIGHAGGWLRRDVEMMSSMAKSASRQHRLWRVKGCLGGGEEDDKPKRCIGLCGAGADAQADELRVQTKFTRHCKCMELRSSTPMELSRASEVWDYDACRIDSPIRIPARPPCLRGSGQGTTHAGV